MVRPSSVPDTKRRRGNPNWGRPPQPLRGLPTEFEIEVKRLRLSKREYVTSSELKLWCERNRNRCYIPEWLLEAWNMEVEATFSGIGLAYCGSKNVERRWFAFTAITSKKSA